MSTSLAMSGSHGKAQTAASLRCPFADCQNARGGRLAGDIYFCGDCQRLALACEACQALNRPLSRFCRHCRDDMLKCDWQADAATQWRNAARFPADASLADPTGADDICDLRALPGFRKPNALSGLAFGEGLLALHQPGALMALVHPFADQAAKPVVWHDRDLLNSPAGQRAFAPFNPPGNRFWIFSSSTGVVSVDGWSLPGWSTTGLKVRTLIACSETNGPRLAAAPVVLGEERLGLLLRRADGSYIWAVVDAGGDGPALDLAQHLPLERLSGKSCQMTVVGQTIAVATSDGHWIWPVADAARSHSGTLQSTWPKDNQENTQGGPLLDDDGRGFSYTRQVVWQTSAGDGRPTTLHWCFQQNAQQPIGLSYQVRIDSFSAWRAVPISHDGHGIVPVGLHRQARDSDRLEELLCLRGGRLFRQLAANGQLSEIQGVLHSGTELSGVRFCDPLVVCVVAEAGWRHCVEVLSVEQPQLRSIVSGLTLRADPVVWSHWLFTYEETDDHCLLRRRRLSPPTD